jgi:uncharacterized protein YcbK (DUF882 family)
MKVSLELASNYFEVTQKNLYSNPKYSKYISKAMFDMDRYLSDQAEHNQNIYLDDYDEDHVQLLEKVIDLKSDVIISGYRSNLYMDMLKDWEFITFESRASSKAGTVLREECLWIKPSNKPKNLFS